MRLSDAVERHKRACRALGLAANSCQPFGARSLGGALARFGRWFALHRMLPQWRLHEPAIRELRLIMDHYSPGKPAARRSVAGLDPSRPARRLCGALS